MNDHSITKSIKVHKQSKILRSRQNSIPQYQQQSSNLNSLATNETSITNATNINNSKNDLIKSKNQRRGSLAKQFYKNLTITTSDNSSNDKRTKANEKCSNSPHKVVNSSSSSSSSSSPSVITSKSSKTTTTTTSATTVPVFNCSNDENEHPPYQKIERSNSFFLTRKLSKIFNSITGSKDNLRLSNPNINNDDEYDEQPTYKFTRSRSMILLRRPKRSVIEQPKLEQLSEEIERIEKSPTRNIESNNIKKATSKQENHKTDTDTTKDSSSSHQPKKRSVTIISTLKRTFSNSSSDKKKDMNPRWSASLHSLQEIDNMISYENLSFIDYDKLGSYEKFLEQSLSYQDLTVTTPSIARSCSVLENSEQPIPITATETIPSNTTIKTTTAAAAAAAGTTIIQSSLMSTSSASTTTVDVVRRRNHYRNRYRNEKNNSVHSNFDMNIDSNFDKPRNLYRQSLDDRKLKHMNDVQRESFRLSGSYDPLYLNNLNIYDNLKFNDRMNSNIRKCKSFDSIGLLYMKNNDKYDVTDAMNFVSSNKLKSKSLTHLDSLDSMIACHQQSPTVTHTNQKVPSSEYFSVYFCTEAGYQEEELIPATKGVTLLDALSNSLKKRNLSFSQITISDNNFQICTSDTGSPPYTSSLEENTDVENLAGKVLIVSEKDGSKKIGTLQKAASFGSRTRPPRLLSSASTEETTTEIEQKQIPGKQLKQRWSGLFGIKNPQQSQLCELLNNYAKNGVPQKTSSVNFDHPNFDMALEYLDNIHKTWRDIVNCDNMTDTDIKIQSAIWELVSTEVDYIHALQTVTDLFLACLEAIQEEKLLIDVDQNKLFSNIRDICEANLKFWTYYLYPMVDNSIKTKQPMCIDYFQPGFVTFATTFSPYKKYCAEQSTCQYYCKELNRNNALFTAYLAWCESQKMCNRLRLADILVRPMQRLTKYSLLLTAIRKHIADENEADVIDSMIHSVESFVYSVNTHLTTRQENERLKGIMARIESYDIVDSNNEQLEKLVKQYSTTLDLCAPMKGCLTNQGRHLFMEGDLKLKDNFGKSDVHCFLLTDILLICKTIAKKGQGTLKVIRQPYLTDKLIVKHKDNTLYCVYLNEFQIVINAFTLQCNEAKNWNDAITKAKHIYSRLKQGSNWDSYNLRYGSSIGSNNADTLLGIKKSPLNSSIGSRVSSLNNSHSGSVELNDSRNISVDFEKTNSLSSDEGSNPPQKPKTLTSPQVKTKTSFSNTLTVQPLNHLGQSLPNLNLHPNQASNLYHTYSNNTLLVPGSTHSGNVLLSPSHRGISYPPPSPTRATLRRGFAFSSSIKNPPLVKTRNITSQSSINWHQIPATPQSSPQSSSSSHQSHKQQQQHQQQPQQQQQQQSPTTVIPTQQHHQQQQHSPIHMATGLQINESDV